jgi:hypothetical protein
MGVPIFLTVVVALCHAALICAYAIGCVDKMTTSPGWLAGVLAMAYGCGAVAFVTLLHWTT